MHRELTVHIIEMYFRLQQLKILPLYQMQNIQVLSMKENVRILTSICEHYPYLFKEQLLLISNKFE